MSLTILKDQKVSTDTLGKAPKTRTTGSRTMGDTLNFINTPGNPFVRPSDMKGASGRARIYAKKVHDYLLAKEAIDPKIYFLVAEYEGELIMFDNTENVEKSESGNVRPSTGKSVTRTKLKEGETVNKDKFKIDLAGAVNHLYKHFPEIGDMEFGNRAPIKITLSDTRTTVFTDGEGKELYDGAEKTYWVLESIEQGDTPKVQNTTTEVTVVNEVVSEEIEEDETDEEVMELETEDVEF